MCVAQGAPEGVVVPELSLELLISDFSKRSSLAPTESNLPCNKNLTWDMPEFGARPLVWADGEVLHSCLNLKAIRNSWFQGNACLLCWSKSSNSWEMGVPSWPRSLLILVSAPPVTCPEGQEKINKCLTHREREEAWLLLQKVPTGEAGVACLGSIKQWVSCGKFSAWVQNLASALIFNQKQRVWSGPVRDLSGSWLMILIWIESLCEMGCSFC